MIVYDKNIFGSNREIDPNGYLRVDSCNITKTQVAPYLGREIPGWRDMGLESEKIYYVLRPENELRKAVPTFNNLPLTREHIEVDVENVPKDKIVGSLGDHAEYSDGYIKNNLIVYDQKDIDLIMSGKKKELSCGYRYTPVKEHGVFDGQEYDFVMTDIIGNHIALVKEGRAGHDVVVSDTIDKVKEKFMNLFRKKEIVNDEFKESEHPRAKNGQFTNAGGSEKKDVFKSRFSKHTVRRDDPNYKAQLSAAKNDLKDAISAFEKNVENQEEKFKWIEQQKLDMARADLEDLEKFEKESSEKDIIESLKNKFPRKSEKKDGASEYKKERLKDVEAVSGKETEFYKAKEKEVDEDIKEAKEYVSSVIKEDTGEYKHGKDYFKHQVEKTKNRYGEESDYYKRAKLHLDLYNEMTNDSAEQEKVGVVMKEFKDGELKSGSGEKVTNPKQAIAIALSEADKMAKDKDIPDEQEKPEKAGDKDALVKGEEVMTEEVKEALAEDAKKAEEAKEAEDACAKDEGKEDDKLAEDKDVDKRKLIDEIGGILKSSKVDDEVIRTVMKKCEEMAYNKSESGEADDEKEEDLKGKEKEAFAEGVDFGEKKEKEEPKKLDSEHESEGAKKADEKKEAEDEDKKEDKKEMAKDSAMAMDIDSIKEAVREEMKADFNARECARKAVRSIVGDVNVMAFDSAEDIYKFACEKAGMDLDDIVSYKDAFKGLTAGKSKLALDASPKCGSNEECFKNIRIA